MFVNWFHIVLLEGSFSIIRKKNKNWVNAQKRENKIRGINITIILIIWKCQKIYVFLTWKGCFGDFTVPGGAWESLGIFTRGENKIK